MLRRYHEEVIKQVEQDNEQPKQVESKPKRTRKKSEDAE
nr:MAG TPA: hypothetical protein [Caudoviricetes sp.]